ncbi:hypothetical protein QZM96_07480 [Burkholderia multivorans]|nr:hypothetical protein [Burkholderia multivorans]MDN8002931.1 hypothetical protein [Burkholderia multivorans]
MTIVSTVPVQIAWRMPVRAARAWPANRYGGHQPYAIAAEFPADD